MYGTQEKGQCMSLPVSNILWVCCCIACAQCDHIHVNTCVLLTFTTISLKL